MSKSLSSHKAMRKALREHELGQLSGFGRKNHQIFDSKKTKGKNDRTRKMRDFYED